MELLKSGWEYLDIRRTEEAWCTGDATRYLRLPAAQGQAYGVVGVPKGSDFHLATWLWEGAVDV